MRVPDTRLWAGEPDDSGETTREFLIADVFTGRPLEGNQLGVFLDGRGLSDDLMLKATRELNFSETVFFLPPDAAPGNAGNSGNAGNTADAHVRIFTPGGELPFAGHPTLGSAWVLGEMLGKRTVTLQLGVGLVPVELERDNGASANTGTITFGRMSQPVPVIEAYDGAAALLDALGAAAKTAGYRGSLPAEIYVNGPRNVYVEISDTGTLAKLDPDMQKLARIPLNVSCYAQRGTAQAGTAQAGSSWVTRMFAPALGVTEDPATGSAAGPLAVHLARHGRIAFGEEIEIRQGAYINRPSVLYARAEGTRDKIAKVIVGGRAVIVARGEYLLG